MGVKNWAVYLLRCSDGSLYCGVSNNVEKRVIEHNAGLGAKYTRSRRPVVLVGTSRAMTKVEAFQLEYRIKRLPADQKIAELEEWPSDISKS
jgi:putative endonuclease